MRSAHGHRGHARPLASRLLWGAAGLALALAVGGCRGARGPAMPTRAVSEGVGPTATVAVPTRVVRSADPAGGAAQRLARAQPSPSPAAITYTVQAVAFREGLHPLPGPWSPDGRRLVAFVAEAVTAGDAGGSLATSADTPVGAWIVDAEGAVVLADLGDVRDELAMAEDMVAWLADGTLAVARGQDTLVSADGKPLASIGSERQTRRVEVAPDGRSVLAVGPRGAWLIAGEGREVAVLQGGPQDGYEGWDWRSDGSRLALSGRDGGLYVADVARPVLERVAQARGDVAGGRYVAPRWLADGRVLMSDAVAGRMAASDKVDHRVIDPDGGPGRSLGGLVGLANDGHTPRDASGWVSADGAYVLVPEVLGAGEPPEVRWWLLDVLSGERREAPAMSQPVWSPSGARVAYRARDGVGVWRPDGGADRQVSLPGRRVASFGWSDSARWLALVDEGGGLWVAAVDVVAGPTLVAESIDVGQPPTISPDDSRLAVTALDERGHSALLLLAFGIDRP